NLLHRSLRHWPALLCSRPAHSRPPFLSRRDDSPATSSTQLAFLWSSHGLGLTLPRCRPSLPLCSGNPSACSNAHNSLCWSRPICCNSWWPPWPPLPQLVLNPSDGLGEFGFLRLVPDQCHRQQILIRACVFCHACCLLVESLN